DLVRVCDKLNNTPLVTLYDTLEKYMDVDRVLWFLACENAFADDDGYIYKGKMDYCLYWDEVSGRITTQEYDGNSILENQNVTWGPFYHATDPNYPLLYKLLQVPELRQRYLAHLRSVMAELLDQAQLQTVISGYATLVDTIVLNDPKKLMTYTQFTSGWPAFLNLFNTRRNTLNSNSEVVQVAPTIGTVDHVVNGQLNVAPTAGGTVNVRAMVGSGVSSVSLFWCPQLWGSFERLAMFDDGLHDDGASGDGTYGASIPGQNAGSWVRYYVEAKANNTALSASYAPPGAEHDVFVYQVQLPPPPQPSVVINEVMAKNVSTAEDEYNEAEDWIELYNPTPDPVDLSGWFLTDTPFDLYKWPFPAGSSITGYGYLIVWADEDGWQAPLHANFKLSGDGEEVRLINADSMQVDAVLFGEQFDDLGYARLPNGYGPFVIQQATFAATNDFAGVNELEGPMISAFPNPTSDGFTFLTGSTQMTDVSVYDATARRVWNGRVSGRIEIDASNWATGSYTVKAGSSALKLMVIR
ncbi:MAG: lamin tail domain-containing protein, partial [Flavobacteriales bacterium]|nr:lamin tail domain-containing protein [Flavobacteriales bacterium]